MAARQIKTADEHVRTIDAATRKRQREQSEFKRKQRQLEDIHDIRDDLLSILKNSGMSDEDVHAHCGPTPATLRRWREDKNVAPKAGKMRSVGRIVGVKLVWQPVDGANDA